MNESYRWTLTHKSNQLTVPDRAVFHADAFLEPAHRPVAQVAYAIKDKSRALQRQRHSRFVRQTLGVHLLAVAGVVGGGLREHKFKIDMPWNVRNVESVLQIENSSLLRIALDKTHLVPCAANYLGIRTMTGRYDWYESLTYPTGSWDRTARHRRWSVPVVAFRHRRQ